MTKIYMRVLLSLCDEIKSFICRVSHSLIKKCLLCDDIVPTHLHSLHFILCGAIIIIYLYYLLGVRVENLSHGVRLVGVELGARISTQYGHGTRNLAVHVTRISCYHYLEAQQSTHTLLYIYIYIYIYIYNIWRITWYQWTFAENCHRVRSTQPGMSTKLHLCLLLT